MRTTQNYMQEGIMTTVKLDKEGNQRRVASRYWNIMREERWEEKATTRAEKGLRMVVER